MAFDGVARVAWRRMICRIAARPLLSGEDVPRLCSLAADIRVTQVVNRSKGIYVLLARSLPPVGGHTDQRWTST